jgi:HEPN domain-containing protein
MKQREQALLLLRKAAQDEALPDEVLSSDKVSDEVVGFHCQQAVEKMLKALLSDLGVRFRKTHDIGALVSLLAGGGHPLPRDFEDLDSLTPFAAVYRYEDFDSELTLDRERARSTLRLLRAWVEERLGVIGPSGDSVIER